MSKLFKFGDMVRHPDFKTECVFIRQYFDCETGEKTWAEVFNDDECETQTRMVTHEHLELISRREIVQIATAKHKNESCCYALCNDSTVWREAIKTHQEDGSFEHTWERLPLIPQD